MPCSLAAIQLDRNLTAARTGNFGFRLIKPAFHYADTDILARIVADTPDTRDFL